MTEFDKNIYKKKGGNGMFQTILEYLKHPVTTLIEKAEQEDIKKGGIKLAIISGVMSLMGVITKVQSIFSKYSKDGSYASWYGEEGLAEARSEAFKEAELIGTFFKTWLIYAAVIAVVALILFIIAKILKSEKSYASTLSMSTNSIGLVVVANIVGELVALLYAPLGAVIMLAAVIYASYALIHAFRDSLGDVDVNKLVLVTTAVIVVIVIIAALIISNQIKSSLGSLSGMMDLLN